jgi:hypothetical protein
VLWSTVLTKSIRLRRRATSAESRRWALANAPILVYLVVYAFTCLLAALLFLGNYRPLIRLFQRYSGTHVPSLTFTQGVVVLILLCGAPIYLWLGYALARRVPGAGVRARALEVRGRSRLDTPPALSLAVFGLCGVAACVSVGRAGAFGELSSWLSYGRFVAARQTLFAHLHFVEFVNIYMFLPFAAAWVLLTQRRAGVRWLVVRWCPLAFTIFIDLLLFQKKTAVVSLLIVGFAWFFFHRRTGARRRRLVRGASATVAVGVTMYFATVVVPVYSETSNGGGALPTLALYSLLSPVTRTSAPVLYYPIVYPRQHAFYGLDLFQDELGFPSAFPNDNQVIWAAQNPHGPFGTSAAPFQFSLYSGTGLFGALFETLVIGGLMGLAWRLFASDALPAVWGSLLCSAECVFGVYLAIDSWRNDTTVSYGALWALLFVAVAASATHIVNGQVHRLALVGRWWRGLLARLESAAIPARRNVARRWESARPWLPTVAYGMLWIPIAVVWALRSPFEFTESQRAVVMQHVLLADRHGYGPLVAMIGPHAFQPAPLGDDAGGYLFTPWLMDLFGLRNVDTALGGAFAACVAAVVAAYPYFIRRLTGSRTAAALSPILALAAFSFIAPDDFYWVPACTVCLCVPWLLVLLKKGTLAIGPSLVIAALAGLTNTFRSNTGLGIVIALGAVIVMANGAVRRRLLVLAAVAACYLLLSSGLLSLAYAARADRMQGYPVNTGGSSGVSNWSQGAGHPFWHAVYLSLGVVKNPYGIRWNDSIAAAYVRSVDPKAGYLSAQYEAILRKRVIFIAEHDPGLVINAVATKGGIEFANVLDQFPILLLLVPLALVTGVARRRRVRCAVVLTPIAAIALLPVLVSIPLRSYEVPWLSLWAAGVVLTGSAVTAWLGAALAAQVAGAPVGSPLGRRAEMVRARVQLGLDASRRALLVVPRSVATIGHRVPGWGPAAVSVIRDLRQAVPPLLRMLRTRMRSRSTVLVVAALVAGVVAESYLNTLHVDLSPTTTGSTASASASTASALASAAPTLPASTHLPPPITTAKLRALPAGWSYGDHGVKLRAAGGHASVQTTPTLDGYQLMSPTHILGRGSYVATVLGRVARGGLELGVLDVKADRWIATALFARADGEVIMPLGFSLVRPTLVQVVLSNYSLRRQSSLWDLARVGLYGGSVASLAVQRPSSPRRHQVRVSTKPG